MKKYFVARGAGNADNANKLFGSQVIFTIVL